MNDNHKLTDEQKKYFAERIEGFSNILTSIIEFGELDILEKADDVMTDFVWNECFIVLLKKRVK